ncbi:uncharacterized protein [Paramormyrops kingsleyae]|uniref:uncharacterized protein isoform X2 n=1 Tax=Paramormyrops kingsleyae TaxID=1676925 RepID=UPI000CD5D5EB|nr:uncharacterized protein LOC111841885 isoform X2 [Paramormyrops kingsleyae]
MIRLCSALLLLFLTVVNLVLLTQAEHMKTFHLGDTVTLHCSISSVDSTYFYWFKQAVGESPQSIMSVYSYNMELVFYGEFQGDQRFAVHKNSTNMSLTISNAKPMDSGFYFCCTREYERIIFWNNFFLKYEGLGTTKKYFSQQPVSNSVHPGDSVTLQCTIETESCAGEHGVYWFKHGSGESLPGVIYTHGNRSDKCKKSSEAGSPTQSCVYSLPKRNLSLSDAGTYYCAVAMCGEILFGNGTKLNIKGTDQENQADPLVLGLTISNILCVILIIVLIYIQKTRIQRKTHHPFSTMPHSELYHSIQIQQSLQTLVMRHRTQQIRLNLRQYLQNKAKRGRER